MHCWDDYNASWLIIIDNPLLLDLQGGDGTRKREGGRGWYSVHTTEIFFNKIKFRNLTRDIWSAYSLFFLDNLIYKYWSGFPGCFF